MAGSKATMCSEHSRDGMIDVRSKRCSHSNCSTWPSYGMADSNKREMCSQHALYGMINLKKSKKCRHPNCSKRRSFGMAGSQKVEMCSEHARAGMTTNLRLFRKLDATPTGVEVWRTCPYITGTSVES